MSHGVRFLKRDNFDAISEEFGIPVEDLQKAYLDAEKRWEVLYVAEGGELMPIKSWMCDGENRRPGCKELKSPHSRHSIWENAK